MTYKQFIDKIAKCPQVRAKTLRESFEDFWSPNVRCATCRQQGFLNLDLSTPSEVAYSHFIGICEQDVIVLQISMHHPTLVHVVDANKNLREEPSGLLLWKLISWHLGSQRSQGASRTVFEHHVHMSFILDAAEEPQNVAVLQSSLESNLPLQLR
jgi:hypothetical protein